MAARRRIFQRGAGTALVIALAAAATWKELCRATLPSTSAGSIMRDAGRFEELKDRLPAHGPVCFLSDRTDVSQPAGAGPWYLAEYVLAPVVLRLGADCDQVIGSFSDPAAAPRLIEANGLEIERRYSPDLMLLRRRRP